MMKKVFIVAGELSGDRLGAWYVRRLQQQGNNVTVEAVGGDHLKQAGACLYETIDKLNVVGIVEIISHIPRLWRFLSRLVDHIVASQVDEVVLVDFPGFNLRLAKQLKKRDPHLTITYLSPPQVWVWGRWRIQTIKKYCDHVVVLYPFEVAWYKKQGITAMWYGYPFYDDLALHFSENKKKEKAIAFLLGSRRSELEMLFPLFVGVARKFAMMDPEVKIVLPIAETFSVEAIKKRVRQAGLDRWLSRLVIVKGEQEKFRQLSSCCLAITKPGTITLELALLGVPSLIVYRTSWLTHAIASLVVNVKCMGLPNLLLDKEVCKELLQRQCAVEPVWRQAVKIYQAFIRNDPSYVHNVTDLLALRAKLKTSVM